MSDIKVSVIIPVYNAEEYLAECLESVLGQTLREIEVICVDDGSTDESLTVLQDYAKRDSRLKVLQQENAGAGTARNLGMSQATGKYLSFLDSDDVFESDMLEEMYNISERDLLDVAVCRCEKFVHETGETRDSSWTIRKHLLPKQEIFSAYDVERDFFEMLIWWPWDKLFRADFIREKKLEYQELRTTNDLYFVVMATLLASRIECIDKIFIHQRVHDESLVATREKSPDNYFKALRQVRNRMIEDGIYDQFEQDFANYCVTFTAWQVRSMGIKGWCAIWPQLPALMDEFGISDKKREYFYKEETWESLRSFLTIPEKAITVLMPSLNVGPYIRECIESVCNQSFRNLEIICIDAGSTDGTLEILKEYEESDPRVHIIHSDIKSYGYQMNMGLKEAHGEYIGIVETDDFIDSKMYESLYRHAKSRSITKPQDADVVKANWYRYQSFPVEREEFFERYKGMYYYNPLSPEQKTKLINGAAGIWSGIYKREFLEENNINFLETPGASYQDTAFILKVWMAAKTPVLLKGAFLRYRIDNENSSVHSSGKAYYVCDELDSAFEYMNQRPAVRSLFLQDMWHRRADVYRWNFNRLDDEIRPEFVQRIKEDFSKAYSEDGSRCEFNIEKFLNVNRRFIEDILSDPDKFIEENHSLQKKCETMYPDRPVISVIVDGLNAGMTIEGCLKSIAAQSFENYEILYIDRETVDDSLDIVRKYAESDSRIHMVDTTSGYGRREAVKAAQGAYIYFADARTYFENDAFSRIVEVIVDEEPDILFTRYKRYDLLSSRMVGGEMGKSDGDIYHITDTETYGKVYRRDYAESIGYESDRDAVYRNDTVFSVKALYKAKDISEVKVSRIYHIETSKFREHRCINMHTGEVIKPWEALLSDAEFTDALDSYGMEGLKRLAARCLTMDFYKINNIVCRKQLIDMLKKSAVLSSAGIYGQDERFYITKSDYSLMNLVLAESPDKKLDRINREAEVVIPYRCNTAPDISVIIPVYNVEEYLEECLDSICNQTERSIEIICVNDGSSDGSEEIVRRYAERDERISLINQTNSGQSIARNTAVNIAKGRYIYFIDSDDYLLRETLETLKERMDAENLDVLYFEGESFAHDTESEDELKAFTGNYRRHFSHYEVKSGRELLTELWNSGDYWVSPCMQMVRRNHFVENELWFYPGIIYEDNLFTFKSMLTAKRTACIDKSFYMRRVRSNSTMTNKQTFRNCYCYFKVYKEMVDSFKNYSINIDEPVVSTVYEIIRSIQRSAQNMFSNITEHEQLMCFLMNIDDLLRFDTDIRIPAFEMISNRRNQREVNSLKRSKSEINNHLQQAYREKSDRGEMLIRMDHMRYKAEMLSRERYDQREKTLAWDMTMVRLKSQVRRGVHFDVSGRSIIATGTNQSDKNINYVISERDTDKNYLNPGEYYLDGCPLNGGGNTYRFWLAGKNDEFKVHDEGCGVRFTVKERTTFGLAIDVKPGMYLDGEIFTPRIYRYGDLRPKKMVWKCESIGLLGRKEKNGISFTKKDDGVVVDGQNEGKNTNLTLKDELMLEAGEYLLEGCPYGGGVDRYRLKIFSDDKTLDGADEGYGFTFKLDKKTKVGISILVKPGTRMDEKRFEPKLYKY